MKTRSHYIPNYDINFGISSAVGGPLQRCLPSDFRRECITECFSRLRLIVCRGHMVRSFCESLYIMLLAVTVAYMYRYKHCGHIHIHTGTTTT